MKEGNALVVIDITANIGICVNRIKVYGICRMVNNVACTGRAFGNGKFHQHVWVCLSACGGINHAELKILDAKLGKKGTTEGTY